MVDVIDKKAALRRYFPAPFWKLKDGQGLTILLDAFGDDLNRAADDIASARQQFLLATATGQYLQTHGVNVDIFRPRGYNMSDTKFRELIKIVTNSRKNTGQIFERLLRLFFGAACLDNGLCDVYSYRNHEIIVQIKSQALIIASTRSLYGTTYLHRDPANGFDGFGGAGHWSTTVASNAPAGSLSLTLASAVGVPAEGVVSLGQEIKGYNRSGAVLDFHSPVVFDHLAGETIGGPVNSDDYPSGYVYPPEAKTGAVGSYLAGVTAMTVEDADAFPDAGPLYLDDPADVAFESLGFTRVGNVLTFDRPTVFPHVSGSQVTIPCLVRAVKTTLNQTITAGQSFAQLAVADGADFPLDYYAALRLNRSFPSVEDVPFVSRKVGDNSNILIDPSYVFRKDHAIGEKVQLMARKTAVNKDGTDWPFFLNDTQGLQNQFFNILRRVKVTGCKIVFQLT